MQAYPRVEDLLRQVSRLLSKTNELSKSVNKSRWSLLDLDVQCIIKSNWLIFVMWPEFFIYSESNINWYNQIGLHSYWKQGKIHNSNYSIFTHPPLLSSFWLAQALPISLIYWSSPIVFRKPMFYLPTPGFVWKPVCQQYPCAESTCQSQNLAQATIWPISNRKQVHCKGLRCWEVEQVPQDFW